MKQKRARIYKVELEYFARCVIEFASTQSESVRVRITRAKETLWHSHLHELYLGKTVSEEKTRQEIADI